MTGAAAGIGRRTDGRCRPWRAALMVLPVVVTVLLLPGHASAQPTNVYEWGSVNCCVQNDTPMAVDGIPNTVVQIVATNGATYALDSTGAVWAWGRDSAGELGNGTLSTYESTPTQVQFPAGVVIAWLPSPMPYDTGMAVDTNGALWGWGLNGAKALCMPGQNIDLPVQSSLTDVTLASGAGNHAVYDAGGHVYGCGDNSDGDLGNGSTTRSRKPVTVVGLPAEPVRSLVTAWGTSGALMADGSFYSWGYNAAGQLGDGTTTYSSVPVQVALEAPATSVYQGGSLSNNGQTLAILSDGSAWAWGSNTDGQLGDGNRLSSSVPVEVEVPNGVSFAQVATGGATSYAIDSTGKLWSWGQNTHGQLGSGAPAQARPDTPVSVGISLTQILTTAENVAAIG